MFSPMVEQVLKSKFLGALVGTAVGVSLRTLYGPPPLSLPAGVALAPHPL